MKNTKRTLTSSIVTLILCFSMLLGTTYAWFTDSAISSGNIIQSGNLDVEMYWSETLLAADSTEWKNVEETANGTIFTYDNWEPGYTDVKYVKVKNAGNLALQWRLSIAAQGEVTELADVIDVYYVNPVTESITTLADKTDKNVGVLTTVLAENKYTNGVLLPAGEVSTEQPVGETILAIAFHMQEEAGNKYQKMSIGDGFSVSLIATQYTYESDAFGNTYDELAQWPKDVILGTKSAKAPVANDGSGNSAAEVSLANVEEGVSATIPAGVKLAAGATELELKVSDLAEGEANVVLNETEAMLTMDVHVDGVAEDNDVVMKIVIEKILPKSLSIGNFHFYHVENGVTNEMTQLVSGATPVHNNFEYVPETGDIVLYLKSFSEIATVVDKENAWKGNYDYSWYANPTIDPETGAVNSYYIATADQLAAFGTLVGGMYDYNQTTNTYTYKDSYVENNDGTIKETLKSKVKNFAGETVKLIADINIGDTDSENGIVFYPIGAYRIKGSVENGAVVNKTSVTDSSLYGFKGTFDGDGHTVKNFYQNTWEMEGDYHDGYPAYTNYYKDAMGLFGYVYHGTVKNLTIENFSSDGEFTPTGVVAAYAAGDATFKNIAIKNCNPRVYNTGNGGIIGIAGDTSERNDDHITLENITVDNSNKISALWGSWDVACGGLVGMYRGNVDSNGATGDTITITNCHVAAQIDVNNDVCANYQYYWYRYSGMIIGSVRHGATDAYGYTVPAMDGITVKGCTVDYGDWNQYYYCELVANSLASYTHDHQFSRLTPIDSPDAIKNADGTYKTTGNFVYFVGEGANRTACCLHIVSDKDGDGNLDEHTHDSMGKQTVNGQEIWVEDHRVVHLPFNQLIQGYGWGVKRIDFDNKDSAIDVVDVTAQNNGNSVQKFVPKFQGENTFAIGNENNITVGDLFSAAVADDKISTTGLWITVQKFNSFETVTVDMPGFTSDSWDSYALNFDGTGTIKLIIQDYKFCTPTEIVLQVVDGLNVRSWSEIPYTKIEYKKGEGADNSALEALGWTPKYNALKVDENIVLLADCTNNTAYDSVGMYLFNQTTLYGNNFTVNIDKYGAQIWLNSGVLNNVQILQGETTNAYINTYGDSRILNSYIKGSNHAVYARAGTLNITNSFLKAGTGYGLRIAAAVTDVILDNTTIVATSNANKVMGFPVRVEDGSGTIVTIAGNFQLYAWQKDSAVKVNETAGVITDAQTNDCWDETYGYNVGIFTAKNNNGFEHIKNNSNNVKTAVTFGGWWSYMDTAEAAKGAPTYGGDNGTLKNENEGSGANWYVNFDW